MDNIYYTNDQLGSGLYRGASHPRKLEPGQDYRGNRVFQISSAQNVYVCCGHSHSQVYLPQATESSTDACIYSKTPDRYRTVLWLRHQRSFFRGFKSMFSAHPALQKAK